MKKLSMILSHLTNQPQFKYLKQEGCFKKYISLLSPKWQKAIAFIYIKNNTLFIAVTHPGFKMELHYNRDLLKSILTQMSSYDKDCKMLQVGEVVIFHSKYRPVKKEEEDVSTVPYYNELATASFDIDNIDKDLQEKFNQTKDLIKEQMQ